MNGVRYSSQAMEGRELTQVRALLKQRYALLRISLIEVRLHEGDLQVRNMRFQLLSIYRVCIKHLNLLQRYFVCLLHPVLFSGWVSIRYLILGRATTTTHLRPLAKVKEMGELRLLVYVLLAIQSSEYPPIESNSKIHVLRGNCRLSLWSEGLSHIPTEQQCCWWGCGWWGGGGGGGDRTSGVSIKVTFANFVWAADNST